MDYHASENIPYTREQVKWITREKSLFEKIKEFLFGEETIEKHFKNYPYDNKESEE
jgi:hypothetical protein